ncbi:hypothetical protein UFOVP225_71 [uncultured Caudovirales phage]|uniref:Uncharacterized protein n=1 Tax=uncultured Caudovirales phage TaxID=2100421 RepID=A0A6J5L5U6_9CAUD|nr:hypothetical protein UFOVP113_84 [uncultured Caudovirales phage]CAB5219442.1 hypothetical protein UFOVP225_71 [uncultured Caudovirales phage]
MWENQEPETPAEPEVAPKPTYEELEKLYANAVLDNEQKDRNLAYYRQRSVDFEYKIEKADEWITEEADSLTERQVEELCEILGIETSVTKTVTLSVEIEVEVTAKRGYDFDDISEYDFDITVESSSSDFDIESVSSDINSVDYN